MESDLDMVIKINNAEADDRDSYDALQRELNELKDRNHKLEAGAGRPVAWAVDFLINGEHCRELFNDKWRAEAFVKDSQPEKQATMIALAALPTAKE